MTRPALTGVRLGPLPHLRSLAAINENGLELSHRCCLVDDMLPLLQQLRACEKKRRSIEFERKSLSRATINISANGNEQLWVDVYHAPGIT